MYTPTRHHIATYTKIAGSPFSRFSGVLTRGVKSKASRIMARAGAGMSADNVSGSLANEDGSVLVLALAMLTLLTLIGISATTTSTIEIQVAGNEKLHTQNFYLAEGSAMRCVQQIDDDPDPANITGYMNEKDSMTEADIRALSFTNYTNAAVTTGTGAAAINEGIVGSMKMGQPSLHGYSVYGWCTLNDGLVIVELGYRTAY